ncbi:hypothetical protein QF002_007458 [Paraburkholderia youngii]
MNCHASTTQKTAWLESLAIGKVRGFGRRLMRRIRELV